MTDKEQAIKTLEDMINIAESLKNRDFITKTIVIDDEKVESLKFALESLKVDASGETDREQAITTLTEHLDHWKRLLSEGVCTKDEGERTINALAFAIESIKVDRAYDLAYEKVDFIEIPKGATNRDMIKAMFPNVEIYTDVINEIVDVEICEDRSELRCSVDWWNNPYRKEQE